MVTYAYMFHSLVLLGSGQLGIFPRDIEMGSVLEQHSDESKLIAAESIDLPVPTNMNDQTLPMTDSSVNEDTLKSKLHVTTERLANGDEYTKISSTNQQDNGTRSKQRKLVLHFDNRNTLQVANSVSATTIEQGVNNFLTGVLWGYETDEGEWKWVSTSPSLHKPPGCASCITYFKYLENQIVKAAIDRKDLRAKTGSFINNEGAPFRQFYDALIESLRYHRLGTENREHEDDLLTSASATEENPPATVTVSPQHKRRFSILHLNEVPVNGFRSANGTLYHYILPSFFRLIQHLQATNRDFVIYLRTMGDDSKNFLHNAERVLSNEHPSFQYEKALVINHEPGRITRPNKECISLQMKFPEDSESHLIDEEFLIHEKLVSGTGVHAIKDDFNAWCQTNYHYTTSKPIWFDPDDPDPQAHHILFDDNFRVIDPNDSIVDIRIMDRETRKCRSCAFEFYPELENVFAVQADLYLILAQTDYYIKRVEECEKKLDKLLENPQLLHAIKTKSFAD